MHSLHPETRVFTGAWTCELVIWQCEHELPWPGAAYREKRSERSFTETSHHEQDSEAGLQQILCHVISHASELERPL